MTVIYEFLIMAPPNNVVAWFFNAEKNELELTKSWDAFIKEGMLRNGKCIETEMGDTDSEITLGRDIGELVGSIMGIAKKWDCR